jgi:hypothetical protein
MNSVIPINILFPGIMNVRIHKTVFITNAQVKLKPTVTFL